MPKNNARKWVVFSLIITLLSLVMAISGVILASYDLIWMFVVGLMLFITFFICFFVFLAQAKRLKRMFSKEELIAHWDFDPTEQLKKAEDEYREKKKSNRNLLTVITVFFVFIAGSFAAFGFADFEEAAFFLLIMLGMLALIYVAALTAPRVTYKRMTHSLPEVYIGPYCAWVMGEFVQWKAPMTSLNCVVWEQGENSAISIHYETRQRYGRQPYISRIPVPIGKEQEAYALAENIASINNVEFTIHSVA